MLLNGMKNVLRKKYSFVTYQPDLFSQVAGKTTIIFCVWMAPMHASSWEKQQFGE